MRLFVTKTDHVYWGYVRMTRARKVLNPAVVRIALVLALAAAAAWIMGVF